MTMILREKEHIDIWEGFSFELGDRKVTVIEIPGHTYGSVAFLDETNKMLFSGDTVSDAIIFLFGNHRCSNRYEDSLIKLDRLTDKFESLHPAHGTPMLDKAYIKLVLDDWRLVKAGKARGIAEEMHGNSVTTYKLQNCGFYVERNG